jgi:hypothetical protein
MYLHYSQLKEEKNKRKKENKNIDSGFIMCVMDLSQVTGRRILASVVEWDFMVPGCARDWLL